MALDLAARGLRDGADPQEEDVVHRDLVLLGNRPADPLGRGPQAVRDARRVAESLLQAHGLGSPNRLDRPEEAKV